MADLFSVAGAQAGGSLLSGIASVGGLFGGGGLSERKQMALQAQYNREVMQNQLQWRAEDAKKAGISKQYAMGAPAASFAPSSTFNNDNFFDKVQSMGAGISRAADAYADSKQRNIMFDQERRLNELKIQNAEIANATAASDLAVRRTGVPPAYNSDRDLHIPGQGNVLKTPSRQPSHNPSNRGLEAGVPPAVKAFVNLDGSTTMLPSPEAAEAMEDNFVYQLEHFLRNRVIAPLTWGLGRAADRTNPRYYKNGRYERR